MNKTAYISIRKLIGMLNLKIFWKLV